MEATPGRGSDLGPTMPRHRRGRLASAIEPLPSGAQPTMPGETAAGDPRLAALGRLVG